MPLKVIIIDDELHARNILAHYLHQLEHFELAGQYDNCISCFEAHDLDKIDLILLDINLPQVSGIEFSRTIGKYKAEIIFTTAYSEYALQGYEHNILDYLLKPIEFKRFAKAMEKAENIINIKKGIRQVPDEIMVGEEKKLPAVRESVRDFFFVKADYKVLKIHFKDILYIEGFQEYVRIHLVKGKPVISLLSLKRVMEFLPASSFFRIHRSYIINTDQIEFIQQKMVTVGGRELKIGKNYWDEFSSYLCTHSLF